MRFAHILGITALTAFILLITVLPFLPGEYDSLAVPLSKLAQVFGKVGLLLVPVGVLWMVSTAKRAFAITALVAGSIVWIILSIGALYESLTLGVAFLLFWAVAVWRLWPRLTWVAASAVPLYLIIVPVAVASSQLALAGPLPEFSRNRAMRNSEPLIADIERYRAANGRYPRSLVAVQKDYWPGVIGIREYRYEPSGEAYNLLFEQITLQLGVQEIVMYNPRDEQRMTSHTLDVLQLTPEQLALDQTRGHNAVHDASRPHWKYFWFD